jgi:predicted DsbA family dithiol-disulfide isomerase
MGSDVQIFSDVICPWCYVGKRRLERALDTAGHQDACVRWLPFRLNPRMPREGMSRRDYRAAKFGSWERSLALDAHLTEVGQAEGIRFAFEKISRTPDTLDAHRLIRLANIEGVQGAVVEALFRAYFTEGRNLGHTPTLLDVAAEAGLDRGRSEELLRGDEGLAETCAAEERALRLGVQGVPFFIINGEVALSGAREVSAFLEAFDRAGSGASTTEGHACQVRARGKPTC